MRQVESKYRQFPIALEFPNLPADRRQARILLIKEWKDALGLRYNVDFISFEYNIGRSGTHVAWAFKSKAIALQFKLKFASI